MKQVPKWSPKVTKVYIRRHYPNQRPAYGPEEEYMMSGTFLLRVIVPGNGYQRVAEVSISEERIPEQGAVLTCGMLFYRKSGQIFESMRNEGFQEGTEKSEEKVSEALDIASSKC